jgi:hypothetical protein
MGLFDVLILLLVAGICGALGQAISGFSRGGCLVSNGLIKPLIFSNTRLR